jgi:predicted metal-dependent hydrolase
MTVKSIGEHFQDGIELFNSGRFFECHEAWEQAWLRSAGDEKLYYQGLIQAAVAILHAQRGNLAGSRTLWTKAIDKLGPLPAGHMGIDLEQLRQDLARFLEPVASGQSPTNSPPTIKRVG